MGKKSKWKKPDNRGERTRSEYTLEPDVLGFAIKYKNLLSMCLAALVKNLKANYLSIGRH